ncbi:YigZ family protein [Microbacterium pseudoresistens]|uniref:Putative YigZ family protein n=1 Tax=Microbacterium pseudoresistens TaxID=640634 RepID=A0A7Y9EU91_9MICO|nr:putative YigZ family protein [Microbacterium pseudoresistens]
MSARERSYPSTIAAAVTRELVERKSRFIAHIAPIASVDEADAVIAQEKKRLWDARHHCSAMITGVLGDHARSSDDGEPSGTAGVPMLEVLRRRELTDVVAVVTRYFGGVKLGAGGLVRAYSTAVSDALDEAVIVHRRALREMRVSVPHAEAGRIENILRDWATAHDALLDPPVYAAEALFTLWVPAQTTDALTAAMASASSGSLTPLPGSTRILPSSRT